MKKSVKVLVRISVFLLIIGILWFVNGFMGNPVSKSMANNAAKEYVRENYEDLDLQIEDAFHNFKSGDYEVQVKSTKSKDIYFSISITPFGKIRYDSYEENVIGKYNTFCRLNEDYSKRVRDILDKKDITYKTDIYFGEIMDKEAVKDDEYDKVSYGIDMEDLILDKNYDIDKLGKEAGHIVFYAQDEEVSVKRASEILLDVKNILDEGKVSFYAIDFLLEKPRKESEEVEAQSSTVNLKQFLYEDIYEENLEKRVSKVMADTKEYYDIQDKKKLEEIEKIQQENENKSNQ